ncbi:MAG: hypothetical protein WC444_06900 [Candidatus Paceibacterota bacterium]
MKPDTDILLVTNLLRSTLLCMSQQKVVKQAINGDIIYLTSVGEIKTDMNMAEVFILLDALRWCYSNGHAFVKFKKTKLILEMETFKMQRGDFREDDRKKDEEL